MTDAKKADMQQREAQKTPAQRTYKEAQKIYGYSIRCMKDY
jgi:hypothetical protein